MTFGGPSREVAIEKESDSVGYHERMRDTLVQRAIGDDWEVMQEKRSIVVPRELYSIATTVSENHRRRFHVVAGQANRTSESARHLGPLCLRHKA